MSAPLCACAKVAGGNPTTERCAAARERWGGWQRRRPRIFPKTSEGEQHSEEGRREGKLEGEGRECERRHDRAPAINEEEDDGGIRGLRVAREEGAAGRRRGFPSYLVKAREAFCSWGEIFP